VRSAWHADAALVIPVHVRAHGQLRLLLGAAFRFEGVGYPLPIECGTYKAVDARFWP
jgi:hypothetical protein